MECRDIVRIQGNGALEFLLDTWPVPLKRHVDIGERVMRFGERVIQLDGFEGGSLPLSVSFPGRRRVLDWRTRLPDGTARASSLGMRRLSAAKNFG